MGSFTKGHVAGNITVSVTSQSTSHVNVQNPLGHTLGRVEPGQSRDWNGIHGEMVFHVPNRNHLNAADVPGGFDVHFDNVWMSLRHR